MDGTVIVHGVVVNPSTAAVGGRCEWVGGWGDDSVCVGGHLLCLRHADWCHWFAFSLLCPYAVLGDSTNLLSAAVHVRPSEDVAGPA